MTASIHVRDIDRADRPLIVAEIVETNKTDLARRAYNGPIEVVSSDVIVSRMIGQCIRHPGIADTYEEILGHEVGAEIYIRKCPTGLAGSPFNQTARWFEQAIPIGIVPNGDGDTVLAPADETLVSPDDDIVLVAQDYTSSQPSKTPASDSASSSVAEPWRDDQRRVQRVLLLGWSRKVPDLLTEFGALEGQLEVHCVSVIETQVRERALLRCGVQLDGLHVVHHEADFVSAADLARIDPSGFDSVAIVANDWVATEQETDARTVLGHMVLRELLDDLPSTERPTVVVELLDSANRELFDGWNGDVIVSSVIVSRMVAHIGMRPKLRGVYDALFRAGGAEFYVRPLREFGIQRAAKFLPEELARIASAHGAIFVGIHTSRTTRLDPPRNERIELRSSDSLVVLAADRADARL
jgi:alkylhydroperoxidase family enzyme